MPILSGVSGNALVSAFAVVWTLSGAGASRGPVEGLFSVDGGIIALRSEPSACDAKSKTCLGDTYALGDIPDSADGLHLVVGGGAITWSDASGHFDLWGGHVGDADMHCFAVDEDRASAFVPSTTYEVQLARRDGSEIGTRLETLGRREGWAGAGATAGVWAGAGAEAHLACVGFGDDGAAEWEAVLAVRGFDDVASGATGKLGFTDDEELIDF